MGTMKCPSLLLSLAPPITAILAYFFLGEIISSIGIFGILQLCQYVVGRCGCIERFAL